MNASSLRRALAAIALAVSAGPAGAAPPLQTQPNVETQRTGEAAARDRLHQMTDKLASLKAFTLTGRRHMDAALLPGRGKNEDATIEITVQRPNKLHAVIHSGTNDVRELYYDGKTLTVFDKTHNLYGQAPISGSIDDLIRQLDTQYGFAPPMAEFLANDPDAFIRGQVNTARLGDVATVHGDQCQALALTGSDANATLWVSTATQLPCRLDATFTSIQGNPQMRADFEKWDLQPQIPAGTFDFQPPPGAQKVKMVPVDQSPIGRATP
jgi:hypothetical protein